MNWKSFGSRAFGVVHAAVESQYTYFLHIVYMGIHNLAHNSLLANIREKIQVNLVSYFTIFVISLEMHKAKSILKCSEVNFPCFW